MPDTASTSRSSAPDLLHPVLRTACSALDVVLAAESIPVYRFECWRSPERQAFLYAEGRALGVGTPGHHVTFAGPWQSHHQYGLAADYVFRVGGRWTWTEPKHGMWARFRTLAVEHGLEALKFEQPHVQLVGFSSADLLAGRYPEGGDDSWEQNLDTAIARWGRAGRTLYGIAFKGAPPLPTSRPKL